MPLYFVRILQGWELKNKALITVITPYCMIACSQILRWVVLKTVWFRRILVILINLYNIVCIITMCGTTGFIHKSGIVAQKVKRAAPMAARPMRALRRWVGWRDWSGYSLLIWAGVPIVVASCKWLVPLPFQEWLHASSSTWAWMDDCTHVRRRWAWRADANEPWRPDLPG